LIEGFVIPQTGEETHYVIEPCVRGRRCMQHAPI
jgi:hypothetical protein